VLKITNLTAQRGLSYAQSFFRRKFETARFSHRDEITKMPKFHALIMPLKHSVSAKKAIPF